MIRKFFVCICALNLIAAAESLPQTVLGRWQVAAVLIDQSATRTALYELNDPRLDGRIVTVSPEAISTDLPEDKHCGGPTVATQRTAALALAHGDYRWGIAPGTWIDAMWLSCSDGSMGPDGKNRGTWLALLPGKRLAMRWYDETILILTPLAEDARPDPSFACARASTASEKTICGSVSLAAFDRSVAKSYGAANKRYSGDDDADGLKTLRTAQREWITKRNACGANAACLQSAMENRLAELAQIK